MTKREELIALAVSQLGIKETPANSNKTKYGEWYGLNGEKWCAIFVSWLYAHAGVPLGNVERPNGYQSCQGGYNHWKASGEITKDPQPGDIVLFDWNRDKHADHTGIFVNWIGTDKRDFYSIEGNTGIQSDSNGGSVMHRRRSVISVKAFVSPKVLN